MALRLLVSTDCAAVCTGQRQNGIIHKGVQVSGSALKQSAAKNLFNVSFFAAYA
jgi:hypothetical protein